MRIVFLGAGSHWTATKNVHPALRQQAEKLRDECATEQTNDMAVFQLNDHLQHLVTCRAHGYNEYKACADHELGMLSEDRELHQELLALEQVPSTHTRAHTLLATKAIAAPLSEPNPDVVKANTSPHSNPDG